MLRDLLGRAVDPEEHDAAYSVWNHVGQPKAASIAHAVLMESYSQFEKANTDLAHRKFVRLAVAQRWALSAAVLTRRGHGIQAVNYLWYSLMWHPFGIATTAIEASKWLAMLLLKALKIPIK
jgi:hypothetical protein